jgi:hypothetical protein
MALRDGLPVDFVMGSAEVSRHAAVRAGVQFLVDCGLDRPKGGSSSRDRGVEWFEDAVRDAQRDSTVKLARSLDEFPPYEGLCAELIRR